MTKIFPGETTYQCKVEIAENFEMGLFCKQLTCVSFMASQVLLAKEPAVELRKILRSNPRTVSNLLELESRYPQLMEQIVRLHQVKPGVSFSILRSNDPILGYIDFTLSDSPSFWPALGRWIRRNPTEAQALVASHAQFKDLK